MFGQKLVQIHQEFTKQQRIWSFTRIKCLFFSFLMYFSRYCRSKNDHARLSYRISFINTCSPYASVSANLSKIRTFLWPISVAIKCSASVSAPISSSVLNNVSLNNYPLIQNGLSCLKRGGCYLAQLFFI